MPEKCLHASGLNLLVYSLYLALSILMQFQSGAWSSDFGGHADEGAHVVTSLMVRDYLAGGWKEEARPMRYAETYYERFPKVAIGHYPPGFYAVASVLLLGVREPFAMLLTMVAICAGVGWATWRLSRQVFDDRLSPLVLGALVCLLPLFRTYTAIVMADLLVVLFCLLAVDAFARFLSESKSRDSLLFGVWAAAAILTKGSALCLALVPPIAVAWTGKWAILKQPGLWLAPIPVLLTAFPWMWLTREITSEGMQKIPVAEYFVEASIFYAKAILAESGWLAVPLAIATVVVFPKVWRGSELRDSGWSGTLVALTISSLLLTMTLPTGLDSRYLLPMIPPCLILGGCIARKLIEARWEKARAWVVPVFAVVTLLTTWRTVEKRYTGASEAIAVARDWALDGEDSIPKRILIVTDAAGEGAITAAAAFHGLDSLDIARGSKVLATSDWLGRGYTKTFQTEQEFQIKLEEEEIDLIILELTPRETGSSAHWSWVGEYFQNNDIPAKTVRSMRKRGRRTEFAIFKPLGDRKQFRSSPTTEAIETVR